MGVWGLSEDEGGGGTQPEEAPKLLSAAHA